MKVRVIKEFNDKHTGKLNKIGEEMDISIERINEILKVGGFIELIEQTEPTEQTEEPEQKQEDVQENGEETPKITSRRKRSK